MKRYPKPTSKMLKITSLMSSAGPMLLLAPVMHSRFHRLMLLLFQYFDGELSSWNRFEGFILTYKRNFLLGGLNNLVITPSASSKTARNPQNRICRLFILALILCFLGLLLKYNLIRIFKKFN